MEKTIQDKELGTIHLRTSPRATRYTLKISKGTITATMPPGGNEARMLAFIRENTVSYTHLTLPTKLEV